MPILESKAVTLIKQEGTYGQDPAPGVTDAVITGPVSWEVVSADKERIVVLPYPGKLADIPVGEGIKLSFSMEVFGSGAPATPPKHGPLIRAAGYTQTIGASDVTYDENAAADCDSVTIYWYNDGILYKALGGIVTSIKGNLAVQDVGKLDFELIGMFGGQAAMVSDQAIVTPTFGTLQLPPVWQAAALAIDSYAAVVSKLEFTIANEVVKRLSANATNGILRYSLNPMKRKIDGSLDPEMAALATYNPWSHWETPTTGALTATLGASAGNRLVLNAPAVQKAAPKIGARDGNRIYDLAWTSIVPLTGGLNRLQFKFN